MVIGIDARMWGESGIGRYVRNLTRELVQLDLSNDYVVFCLPADVEQVQIVTNAVAARWKIVPVNFVWYTLKEQLFFPWILYKERLDVIHFPHFNVPVLYFKPFIVTIHDLTHFTFAMKRASTHSVVTYKIKHSAYSFDFWWAVHRSKCILTVSCYVQNEIVKRFGIAASKISVTYEAAEVLVTPDRIDRSEIVSLLKCRYFLYVGNAHPHKNLDFLVSSFATVCKTYPDLHLVLAGKENYFWIEFLRRIKEQGLDGNVHYLGLVLDSEYNTLLQHAVSFVFPSLSEGFGLPVLEAMRAGCPVIAAKTTSLPEVVGSAGILIDPTDQSSLVSAMMLLLRDGQLREDLIQKGLQQVQKFTWREMAERTLQKYTSFQE